MLKKIALGLIFTTVSGGLIYGGVYRTAARLENDGERGVGRRQELSAGARNADGEFQIQNSGNGKGRNGSENNIAEDSNLPDKIGEIAFSGSVKSVTSNLLVVESDNSENIIIENRAWWYAQDTGFNADVNDIVELYGFFDGNGVFEVSWISNLTQDITVAVRDESGRPNWAGGSQGNRNGQS